MAVECGVYPDAPAAHRTRHLALRRAGWRIIDTFPERFDADPTAAAVDIVSAV